MRKLKDRHCNVCNQLYKPKGSCSKYCDSCREESTKKVAKEAVRRWHLANGILNGKGSGSNTGKVRKTICINMGDLPFRGGQEKERKKLVCVSIVVKILNMPPIMNGWGITKTTIERIT